MERVITMRREGKTFREIANALETSVSKVHYHWKKYLKELEKKEPEKNEFEREMTEISTFVLMVQNSECLYTYWEIDSFNQDVIEAQFGQSFETLDKQIVIYDVTELAFNGHNARTVFKAKLKPYQKSTFIKGLKPDATYISELEIHVSDHWLAIMKSNEVHTPRVSPSLGGKLAKEVTNWKEGVLERPNWWEQFSGYTLYENERRKV